MDIKEVAKLGGEATKKKYGKKHYIELNKIRWDRVKEEEKRQKETSDLTISN